MSLMQFRLTMRRVLPVPKDATYNRPPFHSEVFATRAPAPSSWTQKEPSPPAGTSTRKDAALSYQSLACHNTFATKSRRKRYMTVDESKSLKKGNRIYWRGDPADSGVVTETSWDAVTIAWD